MEDILKQVKERYPNVNLLIAPALMQGENAPNSITQAIKEIEKEKYSCDLIILSRGGGSTEDLMPFNDEEVARTIHECPIPVVSGVGHQIDHPICDDVADVQAATPTDAAKQSLPVINDFFIALDTVGKRLSASIERQLDLLREKFKRVSEKTFFTNPYVLLEEYYHRLDDLENKMMIAYQKKIHNLIDMFKDLPVLFYLFGQYLNYKQTFFGRLEEKLMAFSPLATLKRGYNITYQRGQILKSIQQLKKDEEIRVRLFDGEFDALPKN